MTLVRVFARPMLASMFIWGGQDSLRKPDAKAPGAEPVAQFFAQAIPGLPADTTQLIRINGAVQLAAGSLLALGRAPRLASLALAASLVPTTFGGHRFWEAEDPAVRRQQRIQFLKNTSMMGGLLLAAVDTSGQPSVAWRTRAASRRARRQASAARASVVESLSSLPVVGH